MKVLLVTQHLNPGGVETHVATLARQLMSEGHEVIVTSEGGRLANSLVMAGAKLYVLAVAPTDAALIEQSVSELTQIIEAEKVAVVHIHHYLPLFVGVLASARAVRPWIVTAHGTQSPSEWMWYFGPYYYDFCRFALKQAAGLVAVSEQLADQMATDYSIQRDGISVIHNAVDLRDFPFSPLPVERRELAAPLRLLYISRLDSDKRRAVTDSLELLDDLLARGHSAELTILGDGNIRVEVEAAGNALAEKFGRQVVHLAGAQASSASFIVRHDVVLGAGRVVLEGMAVGRPVILAGVNGLVDLITPANYTALNNSQFSGRGFPDCPPTVIRERLCELLSNRSSVQLQLRQLRAVVEAAHALPKNTARIVAVYEAATKNSVGDGGSPDGPYQLAERIGGIVLDNLRGEQSAVVPVAEPPSTTFLQDTKTALFALAQNRPSEAERALRAILAQRPAAPRPSEALARLLNEQEPLAALRVIEPALAAHPHDVLLLYQKSQSLLRLGKLIEAKQTLDDALRYQPNNVHLVAARLSCDLLERGATIRELQITVSQEALRAKIANDEVVQLRGEVQALRSSLCQRMLRLAKACWHATRGGSRK